MFAEKCKELAIGNTPLVKYEDKQLLASVYAKHEQHNATGSIKARPALAMVLDAMEIGKITAGGTIIEATSGNTGIALAYIAGKLGLKCIIVMPDSMSVERRQMIASYGAEVVLTEGKFGMSGAIARSRELNDSMDNSIIVGQFDNQSNVMAHKLTTAVEIITECPDIDVFVAGVGTGGTISGIGEALKQYNSSIEIIAVEPANSHVLSGGTAAPHKVQGIGAGFVPSIFNGSVVDKYLTVSDQDAIDSTIALNNGGWDVGISSGANMHACILLASMPEYAGKNIVTVCPDSSNRYMSVLSQFTQK